VCKEQKNNKRILKHCLVGGGGGGGQLFANFSFLWRVLESNPSKSDRWRYRRMQLLFF
jgi:hypothetical protein